MLSSLFFNDIPTFCSCFIVELVAATVIFYGFVVVPFDISALAVAFVVVVEVADFLDVLIIIAVAVISGIAVSVVVVVKSLIFSVVAAVAADLIFAAAAATARYPSQSFNPDCNLSLARILFCV